MAATTTPPTGAGEAEPTGVGKPRPTGAGSGTPPPRPGVAPIRQRPTGPLVVRFYRSAVGKKWVMAVTGVILMGFVVAHLIGNLKFYPVEGGDQPLRRGVARHARPPPAAHGLAVDDPDRS